MASDLTLLPPQPPAPKSDFELFIERVVNFLTDPGNQALAVKALRVLLSLSKIAFTFIPMTDKQKLQYLAIDNTASTLLNK